MGRSYGSRQWSARWLGKPLRGSATNGCAGNRSRVIVSGGGSQVFGLQEALESGLEELGGGRVVIVDDPVFSGAQGALKLAQDMPAEYWNQIRS